MASALKRIREIIVGGYTLVGRVENVLQDEGTSVIVTETGERIKVRGTAVEVGNKALIKDGIIISQVPNVNFYEFEV